MAEKIVHCKVLVADFKFASRKWNIGQEVDMPESRAKSYAEEGQVEILASQQPAATAKKES